MRAGGCQCGAVRYRLEGEPYGDITAAGPAAGGMAVIEAVVGQLFLTIMIARLVGLHISRRD